MEEPHFYLLILLQCLNLINKEVEKVADALDAVKVVASA